MSAPEPQPGLQAPRGSRGGLRFAWMLAGILALLLAGFSVTIAQIRSELLASQRTLARDIVCNEIGIFYDEMLNGALDPTEKVVSRRARVIGDKPRRLFFALRSSEDSTAAGTLDAADMPEMDQGKAMRGGEGLAFTCPGVTPILVGKDGVSLTSPNALSDHDRLVVRLRQDWSDYDERNTPSDHWREIWVAYDLRTTLAQANRTILLAAVASLVAILLSILAAVWINSRYTRGIARVNATFQAVRNGNIGARVGTGSALAELSALGEESNLALDRIEGQFKVLGQIGFRTVHDLVSPLGLLQMKLAMLPLDRPLAEHELDELVDRAARLKELSEGLLKLAMQAPVQMNTIDLAALVMETLRDIEMRAAAAGLRIESEIAGGLAVMGNAPLLRSILQNLFENVLHHAAPGNVTVSLAASEQIFRLTIANPLHPAVIDTGRSGLGLGNVRLMAMSMGMKSGFRADSGVGTSWLEGVKSN